MKILHLNSSSINGGAAKAAIGLHKSLLNQKIQSYFLSQENNLNIEGSITQGSSLNNVIDILKNGIARKICRTYKSNKKETLSISFFKSKIIKQINNFDCDLVNLHWICNEFISIAQLKRINKPIVWSLYDMWPFSGAEHYTNCERFKDGYKKHNRNKDESGFDINRWTWNRKLNNFNFPIQLVAPSDWLQKCSQNSVIFKKQKTFKIGHPIDTNFWTPNDKFLSKKFFNLDPEKKILLFFSAGSTQNYRKGYDFLPKIIDKLNLIKDKYNLIIVGQKEDESLFNNNSNIKYINFLNDDESRKILYSAADLIIAPSRSEAFGLVVAEAGSCQVPSIGFENTGVAETILHKQSGYLSKKNDLDDFVQGINWFFENEEKFSELGKNSRNHIIKNFSSNTIAKEYIKIYQNIIDKK